MIRRSLFFLLDARPLCTSTMASSKLMNNLAYVDGAWVKATSGKTFDVLNPTTAEFIASVPDMDGADTGRAIEAASKVNPETATSWFLSFDNSCMVEEYYVFHAVLLELQEKATHCRCLLWLM